VKPNFNSTSTLGVYLVSRLLAIQYRSLINLFSLYKGGEMATVETIVPAKQTHSSQPAAMAIPKEGYFTVQNGRYGPIYPRTPACYGFTITAKIKPGREAVIRECGNTIEKTIAGLPSALEVLRLSSTSAKTLLHVSGHLRHRVRQIRRRRCLSLFSKHGLNTVFENLEGFPEDWKTNAPAFVRFVREHQRPSFLEYGEYPYVSANEIKKALNLKAAFSSMLDLMQ
jgi:hypothetical protein